MQKHNTLLSDMITGQTVIPVLKINRVEDAVPLANALVSGGLKTIEVTLRTAAALHCIREIAASVPEAIVGAGTILSAQDLDNAVGAGARFIVSPGSTKKILKAARNANIPLLPGATTPSEILKLRDAGYKYLKFFPADQSGGVAFLKALASPFSDIKFCPTGGISQHNFQEYLALSNVVCVGGSWVAPDEYIKNCQWDKIELLAREAAQATTN